MSTFGVKIGASVIKLGLFIQIRGSKLLISLENATLWKARRQIKTSLVIKDIMSNCDAAKNIGGKHGKQGGLLNLLEHQTMTKREF